MKPLLFVRSTFIVSNRNVLTLKVDSNSKITFRSIREKANKLRLRKGLKLNLFHCKSLCNEVAILILDVKSNLQKNHTRFAFLNECIIPCTPGIEAKKPLVFFKENGSPFRI